MKEVQLHVFLHRLIGLVAISKKWVMYSLLCYAAAHTWLNLSGKIKLVRGWCRLTDLRHSLLTGRLWTGDKLPMLLLFWFFLFLALPRVRVIIICGKDLLFNMWLSVFCRPRMVHFLMIVFFNE
jgi:hypothetical protein